MKKSLYFTVLFFMAAYCLQAQTNIEKSFIKNGKEGVLLMDADIPDSGIKTKGTQPVFAGGTGTEADPYLIATKEHMKSLKQLATDATGGNTWPKLLEGVYFKQMADLVYEEGEEMPKIGIMAWFSGVYDGNHYAIKNYNIKQNRVIDRNESLQPDNKNYGSSIFLNMDGATLKNIRLVDTQIDIQAESDTLNFAIGGLVSYSKNSRIINCTAAGSYSLQVIGEASSGHVAGLISNAYDCEIDNCQSIQDIYCEIVSISGKSYAQAGGIVGEAYNTKLINCTSKGDVVSYGNGDADELVVRAGGMAAWAENCQILNCGNKSGLLSTKVENDQEGGLAYAQTAGMVACMLGGTVDNCWTIAPIKCEGYNAQVSGATPIAYVWNNAVIRSCHYQEDNLKSLRAETEGITGHTAEFMKSQAFIDLLNAHLPEGGLKWKKGTGGYPGILAVHNVTLPILTGATTTPGSGTHEVEEGEHFRFTLILDEEYNQSKPVVTTHTGETLEPDADMNYVTDVVTKDLTIQISGIVKNPATANEEITRTPRVYATDNILYIQPDTPTLVEIFNIQGQKVKSTMISGDTRMQLPQGFYLVRMGERAYKINISK